MAQWFSIISWRLFDVWTSYFGIKGQYDLMFDLKINVGLCDLYFMVLWLCLISPRLFDAWVSYFQIMRQCDPNFWPQNKYKSTWPIFHGLGILLNIFTVTHTLTLRSICRPVTYILWSSDFASYLEDCMMEKHCTWDNGSPVT